MTFEQAILLLTPLLPMMLAALICFPRSRHSGGYFALFAVAPGLLLAHLPSTEIHLSFLLLGSVWHTLPLNQTFLLFTGILWLFSALYGIGYLKADSKAPRFWTLWLLTLSGNLGLLISADMISFYAFFALMTFAAYGLVIHTHKSLALRAGRVYLMMAIIGEMLILTGLFFASAATAHTSILTQEVAASLVQSSNMNLIIFCFFFGFGVKAGIPLLHLWLPLAHPVAPTPASAVLSGAMIKAGLFAWISILPLGHLHSIAWGSILIIIGFIAAFGGGILGVLQREPKAVLAYSSISQMGLMTATVGCLFFRPDQAVMLLPILAFFALHHALTKGALFLFVGINTQFKSLPTFIFVLGMLLPVFALIGLTGSGLQAKLLLKEGLYDLTLSGVVQGVTLSAVATTALMLRFLWLLRQDRQEPPRSASNPLMQISWAGLVLCVFLTPLLFMDTLTPISVFEQPLDFLGLLWVPFITLICAYGFMRYPIAISIPQGDLIYFLEQPFKASHSSKIIKMPETPVKDTDAFWTDAEKQTQRYAAIEAFTRSQIAALLGLLLLMANLLIWLTQTA